MNETYIKNVIEAALLAAGRPLQLTELAQLFDENARPDEAGLRAAVAALEADYGGRGIEVKETSSGFRIQVRKELANEVSRLWPERPPRYSRALLETLALIAYRQPITRAEIESVRGVAVNPNIIKTVIERNWVKVVGTRDVPGRPELLGTGQEFLDYFGLRSLEDLPPLAELKAMGDVNLQLDLAKPEGEAAAAGADGAAVAVAAVAAGAVAAEGVADGAGAHTDGASGDAVAAHADDAGGDAVAAANADAVASASSAEGEQQTSSADEGASAEGEASSEALASDDAATSAELGEVATADSDGATSDAVSADAVAAAPGAEDEQQTSSADDGLSAASEASTDVIAGDTAATSPDLAEAIASLSEADLTITSEALEVEPDTASQAVGHMEIESDSGDVTVEVEALTLVEARIEASIESDEEPEPLASSEAAASADEPVPVDRLLETGEFEMSELGVVTVKPDADEPATAEVIEAEFDAEDLTATAADGDDTDEADDEEELSASSKATTKFVAGPRDNDD